MAELREQHYGQRDVLAMYPRCATITCAICKVGLHPARRSRTTPTRSSRSAISRCCDRFTTELQQGVSFRAVCAICRRALGAAGVRLPHRRAAGAHHRAQAARSGSRRARSTDRGTARRIPASLTTAEQYFLMGSLLDDGTPERQEEAAQAYRRALEDDPDLVAAIINLANIRYARDELAEAQALYERAILLDADLLRGALQSRQHPSRSRPLSSTPKLLSRGACAQPRVPGRALLSGGHAGEDGPLGRSAPHWQRLSALAPEGEWVELAREFSD